MASPTSTLARLARVAAALVLIPAVTVIAAPVATAVATRVATATNALPTPPPAAWWYTELDLPRAWRLSQGAGVTVAVLDTGVQSSIGDLRGQVLPGRDFTSQPGPATTDHGPRVSPLFGHGTTIATMIAGTGRGAGLIGVAPKAKILPVRMLGGAFSETRTAAGIRWAVEHGADIVNMSLGGPGRCGASTQAAVDYAVRHDVLVVASTGNDGKRVGTPANCVGVIAVGALADAKTFRAWPGESFGPQLDFVAPGEHLVVEFTNGQLSGAQANGDSGAAALVSGTFALLASAFPHASARDLVTRALYSVHNGLGGKVFGKRIDDHLGYGEILPVYALRDAPPPHAVNPIYDRIERHLAPRGGTSSSAGPGTGAAISATARPGATNTASPTAVAHSAGSTGLGGGAIAGIVVAVLAIAGIVGVLLARRRRAARAR